MARPTLPENKKFEVVRGQVGPYPFGHVFSYADFIQRYEIPDTAQAKRDIDPDTYHEDLIDRLIGLEVIRVASSDAVATPAPVGPENMTAAPKNEEIRRSARESIESKAYQNAVSKKHADDLAASGVGQTGAAQAVAATK